MCITASNTSLAFALPLFSSPAFRHTHFTLSILATITKPKKLLTTFCLAFGLAASNANAVLIDFDDLTYVPLDPEWPQFSDVPLTNQYASQGLLISDGYLLPYNDPTSPYAIGASQPNYLLAGNFLQLQFTGDLPTFVGMYVSSFLEDPTTLNAYNSTGLLDTQITEGNTALDEEYKPYKYRQYITFNEPDGISSITLEGYYNMRVSGMVDDLTFMRKSIVPEPSSLILFGLGIFGLIFSRFKSKSLHA